MSGTRDVALRRRPGGITVRTSRKYGSAGMRPVSIKLPKNLEALLDELARARGMSRSAVVREALKAYAASTAVGPVTGSVTESAGELVGSLEGPRDLSTAAKHLRGFGE